MSNFTDLTADTEGASIYDYDDPTVDYDDQNVDYDGIVSNGFVDVNN